MELSKKTTKLAGANKKFLKNVVETSSPIQLVVLLYEGCLQWLHMAKEEIVKNQNTNLVNWSNFANYMAMAVDIVSYLQDCLDEKADKQFFDRMFDLYDYVKAQLLKANITKDAKIIDSVYEILKDIKDAWKQASQQTTNKQSV